MPETITPPAPADAAAPSALRRLAGHLGELRSLETRRAARRRAGEAAARGEEITRSMEDAIADGADVRVRDPMFREASEARQMALYEAAGNARRIAAMRGELPALIRAAEVEVHDLRQHAEADLERGC
jgi:hypothetical protein